MAVQTALTLLPGSDHCLHRFPRGDFQQRHQSVGPAALPLGVCNFILPQFDEHMWQTTTFCMHWNAVIRFVGESVRDVVSHHQGRITPQLSHQDFSHAAIPVGQHGDLPGAFFALVNRREAVNR